MRGRGASEAPRSGTQAAPAKGVWTPRTQAAPATFREDRPWSLRWKARGSARAVLLTWASDPQRAPWCQHGHCGHRRPESPCALAPWPCDGGREASPGAEACGPAASPEQPHGLRLPRRGLSSSHVPRSVATRSLPNVGPGRAQGLWVPICSKARTSWGFRHWFERYKASGPGGR